MERSDRGETETSVRERDEKGKSDGTGVRA